MIGRAPFAVCAFAVLIGSVGTAGAQNKCAGTKIKAACKKVSCKSGLEAKAASTGVAPDPAKVAKCEASFSKSFAKAESKGGCTTTGDAAAIEAKVDGLVEEFQKGLDIDTGTNPNKCEGDKIKAAAKKAACKCTLEAGQAQKGGTVDPAKIAKCEASFSKSFAKSEGTGGCNTTGDAATVESTVDAWVSDVDGEIPATSTSSTSSTTSSTTTSTTTSTTLPSCAGCGVPCGSCGGSGGICAEDSSCSASHSGGAVCFDFVNCTPATCSSDAACGPGNVCITFNTGTACCPVCP
jgi:hypothetical protein